MSKIVRSLKNVANGYSSTQILVRNATSNDPSGPTTYDMEEIAAATNNTQTEFLEIMDMLDRRLNDKGKNWRHVAKSLTVLDYLVRYGLEKCVMWSKDNLYIVKTLREFVHFDDSSQDQGALIRVKAKELVSLLQDDERLTRERQNAKRRTRSDSNPRPVPNRRRSDPYDAELQRALELSKETAEEEKSRKQQALNADANDADLQAALKLSLEEEELRKLKNLRNDNLLDLNDYSQIPQQQQQLQFQQYQQIPQQYTMGTTPGFFYQAQDQSLQYDMFGNPIQATGYFPNYGQFGQPQVQQQQYSQPQIPQYTGFVSSSNVNSPPAEELRPLKTGSNNPFALQGGNTAPQPQQPSLNALAQSQTNTQPQFFTQPAEQSPQPQPQQPQQQPLKSRFNDSHELNNLLASGTGVDTFGNTGASRIPHQYTARGSFVASGGVDTRNNAEIKLSSNATGNPFLNTGIGNTATAAPRMNAAPTGYGFGNSKDEPSLIDI